MVVKLEPRIIAYKNLSSIILKEKKRRNKERKRKALRKGKNCGRIVKRKMTMERKGKGKKNEKGEERKGGRRGEEKKGD